MATCYTPSDRRYSDMLLDEFDARRPAFTVYTADAEYVWHSSDLAAAVGHARTMADTLGRDVRVADDHGLAFIAVVR